MQEISRFISNLRPKVHVEFSNRCWPVNRNAITGGNHGQLVVRRGIVAHGQF